MNCSSDKLTYQNSKQNAKEYLVKNGAIDIYDQILDYKKFQELAMAFRRHARDAYQILETNMVWALGDKAAYNEKAFRQIDKIKGYDKDNLRLISDNISDLAKELTTDLVGDTKLTIPVTRTTPENTDPNLKRLSDLNDKIKTLVEKLGITVREAEVIYAQQQEINTLLEKPQSKERDQKIKKLKSDGVRGRTLALADTLNRVINLTKLDDFELSSTLFNEEVLHFAVDVVEQKDPELYQELEQKVQTYKDYKDILADYSKNPDYQIDGKPNLYKIRKEAITKILNQYVSNPDFQDSEYNMGKSEGLLEKIINTLRKLFTPNNRLFVDRFQETADNLLSPDFLTVEDRKYLSGDTYAGLFGTLGDRFTQKDKKEEVVGAKTAKEIAQRFILDRSRFGKTLVNEQERYTFDGEVVPKRVSDFVNAFINKIFKDPKLIDKNIQELALENGKDVHRIFELTFAKFVNPLTGKVRGVVEDDSEELKDLKEKYKLFSLDSELGMKSISQMIEGSVKEVLDMYKDSYFLTEVPIISKNKSVAGTLDLVIIEPTGRVNIYDWKTKAGEFRRGVSRKEIPAWNIKAWRIQLDHYTNILQTAYGIHNFGQVRDVPIMKFDKYSKTSGPKLYQILIGSLRKEFIDLSQRQTLPLPSAKEKTGFKKTDELIGRIYGLVEELEKKTYGKVHKKLDKDALKLQARTLHDIAIDLQVSKSMGSLKDNLLKVLVTHDNLVRKHKEDKITKDDLLLASEAVKELSIYQDIIAVIDELIPEKEEASAFDKALRADMSTLAVDLASKLKYLQEEVLLTAIDKYGAEEFDLEGVSDIENEIRHPLGFLPDSIGKMFNSVYQTDFKTGQLLGRLFQRANNEIEQARLELAAKFDTARSGFLGTTYDRVKNALVTDKERFKLLLRFPTAEELKKNPWMKPVPKLIHKITPRFFEKFDEVRMKFKELHTKFEGAPAKYKSDPGYTEIVNWLEDNIDLPKWKKDFEERRDKYKKTVTDSMSHISDSAIKSSEIKEAVARWEYFNNILESPVALSVDKIYDYLKEEKWHSEEYKRLLKPENKNALDAYNLFRDTALWGKRLGYAKAIYNLPTRISSKDKLKYQWDLIGNPLVRMNFPGAFEGVMSMFKDYTPFDETQYGFQRINAVTLEEEFDIPIRMMEDMEYELLDGKKIYPKDLDLFKIYEEMAMNLAEYETYASIEDYTQAILLAEESKEYEFPLNVVGNRGTPVAKKTALRETLLKNITNATLYGKRVEQDKVFGGLSLNKFISFLHNYTAALYLSLNAKIAGVAYGGSTASGLFNPGNTYTGKNFLKQAVLQFNPFSGNRHLIDKSFNYTVSSKAIHELRTQNSAYLKRLAILGKEYLLNTLSLVDLSIQEQVFFASLQNFAVVDKKIVNIYEHPSDKYPDYYNLSPKEREEANKKINAEVEVLKTKTLEKWLDEQAKKQTEKNPNLRRLDLSGLDKNSVEAFTNRIKGESKRILGNMSEKDFHPGLLGNLSRMAFQFKTWTLRYIKARISKLEFDKELGRVIYGRYNAGVDFLQVNREVTLTAIPRFLQLITPFYGLKGKQGVIDTLKAKYSQYVNKAKLTGEYQPTEKEYIDAYMAEISALRGEIYTILFLSLTLGALFGDDPDKGQDSAWWYYYKSVARGVLKELRFANDPQQLIKMVTTPPSFGALAELKEAIFTLVGGDFKNAPAEIFEATPIARPISAILARYSPRYAKAINVDKRHTRLKKKVGEE